MVNNSTNIIKTNNSRASQIIDHKHSTTNDIVNPCRELGQVQKCGMVNGVL